MARDQDNIQGRAMAIAIKQLESGGFAVQDVSRDRSHKGYDLVARKADAVIRIEVKGCSVMWGIPDPYETEFDADRKLVADYLYVVYLLDDREPQLCVIPRDAIGPEHVTVRIGYRISGKFKNERALKQFLVPLKPGE
jgi:hypothetical protein